MRASQNGMQMLEVDLQLRLGYIVYASNMNSQLCIVHLTYDWWFCFVVSSLSKLLGFGCGCFYVIFVVFFG